MRKFYYNDGELFDKMHSFTEEYSFHFKSKGTYEICLENEHCLLVFHTERYEDSLIMILTDKKTKKRYTFVDLFLAKGSPASFLLKEEELEGNVLMLKVLTAINFLKTCAANELKGDFSTMG